MPTPPRTESDTAPTAGAPHGRAPARERAHRQRVIRRRRWLVLAVAVTLGGGLAVVIAGGGSISRPASSGPAVTSASRGHVLAPSPAGGGARARVSTPTTPAAPPPSAPFAVGITVVRLVDGTRSIKLSNGQSVPRTLVTYVRYPAVGPATGADLQGARPARAAGPFPLIVFGHGFAESPKPYTRLLQAWARAGYVVAAPVFPLANVSAPGGPDESDLPNQPADMRAVISQMMTATAASSGPLSGLINRRQIALAGQSDGADTALAVAYDPGFRDARVGAAIILSGAEIPDLASFQIAQGGPPLLASQGTADPINPPSFTSAFYDSAPAPKYLLRLLGAGHLPPYTSQEPQLGVVERVTIAFLDRYLKRASGALQRLLTAGRVPGVAALDANP